MKLCVFSANDAYDEPCVVQDMKNSFSQFSFHLAMAITTSTCDSCHRISVSPLSGLMMFCPTLLGALIVNCPTSTNMISISGIVVITPNKLKENRGSSAVVVFFIINGLFLRTYIYLWQLLLFCHHWLQKVWDSKSVLKCLKWSEHTSVDWHSFCSEVMLHWVKKTSSLVLLLR